MDEMRERSDPTPIEALLRLMTRLRDRENGCPWDAVQTFATIAPYTIEEAYEVADAIARNDLAALEEELGDLLLQVVFHAEMAREAGAFDFDSVARGITGKMYRRHPHVFGDDKDGAGHDGWEAIKARERRAKAERASALDGVALALPALLRARKLQQRAARVGFDWPDMAATLAKVDEELGELKEAIEDGGDANRARRRDRRPAVRLRQRRPPPRHRPGTGAARLQRQVRPPFQRRRGRSCESRQDARGLDPGGDGRALGGRQAT